MPTNDDDADDELCAVVASNNGITSMKMEQLDAQLTSILVDDR